MINVLPIVKLKIVQIVINPIIAKYVRMVLN